MCVLKSSLTGHEQIINIIVSWRESQLKKNSTLVLSIVHNVTAFKNNCTNIQNKRLESYLSFHWTNERFFS